MSIIKNNILNSTAFLLFLSMILVVPVSISLQIFSGSTLLKWAVMAVSLFLVFLLFSAGKQYISAKVAAISLLPFFGLLIPTFFSEEKYCAFMPVAVSLLCAGLMCSSAVFFEKYKEQIVLCFFAGSFLPLLAGIADYSKFSFFAFNHTRKIVSTFGNSGWFSEYLTILLPVVWYIGKKKNYRIYAQIWAIAYTGVIFINLHRIHLFTAVLFVLYLFLKEKMKIAPGRILVFFLIVILVSVTVILNTGFTDYRFTIWKNAVFLNNKTFGTGPGTFSSFVYHTAIERGEALTTTVTNAHNIFVEKYIETGIFGLILFLIFLLGFILKSPKTDIDSGLYESMLITVFLSLTWFPFSVPASAMIFFCFYGLYISNSGKKISAVPVMLLISAAAVFLIMNMHAEYVAKQFTEDHMQFQSPWFSKFFSAAERFPYNRDLLLTAARVSMMQNMNLQAVSYADRCLNFGIRPDILYLKGLALFKYGRKHEGLIILEQAVTAASHHELNILFFYLSCAYYEEQYTKVIKYFERENAYLPIAERLKHAEGEQAEKYRSMQIFYAESLKKTGNVLKALEYEQTL